MANGVHVAENERLAKLEEKVEGMNKFLFDNGQPGWITRTDKRLESHSRLIWLGLGAVYVLQVLSANGLLNLKHLLGG